MKQKSCVKITSFFKTLDFAILSKNLWKFCIMFKMTTLEFFLNFRFFLKNENSVLTRLSEF